MSSRKLALLPGTSHGQVPASSSLSRRICSGRESASDKELADFICAEQQQGKRYQQQPDICTDGRAAEEGIAERGVDDKGRQSQFSGDAGQHQAI